MPDEHTYGANRDDMTALIQGISHSEGWFPEIKPRGQTAVATAFATITESGENDEFQSVTLYRKAIPDTFTVSTCGTMDFDDMEFTLSESMGTETVLVPAGYKGGEALLIKWNVGVTEHVWSGWAVVAGPTLRCKLVLEKDPVCCPTTQLIKNETKIPFWFFGKVATTIDDPCP
tara:strand:+ start:764 stop:1285 length:522 start_codon:yes stop_codon:yes gene_type:complete